LSLAAGLPASAQFQEGDPGGAKVGESRTQRWRAGVIVTASTGPCTRLVGYVPIPTDWPEQRVKVVEEDVSTHAKISYRTVDNTVKLMVISISLLPAGQEAKALVTLEITRSTILPPDDTDGYALAELKQLDRATRAYLAPSPLIESRDAKIRKLAKQIGVDEAVAWDRIEAIYDWVRENVEYRNGPIKGALAALKDGTGDCEELTSLFIAICRAANIPARTVWVPGHCYPEFYLLDAEGKGHWFPCQAAGTRAFGGIPELRPVLSKGDNFRPPWKPRERQRYLAEYLTVNTSRPRVKWVRQLVSE
jgi:transglutaminase-like putative cysteine protease